MAVRLGHAKVRNLELQPSLPQGGRGTEVGSTSVAFLGSPA